jgi:methylenetetrahydrofolate dehydrogenase (NADP+) / methenyltetrahydrofolate cyclohydrolase
MIVDGKAVAARIYIEVAEGVKTLAKQPVMAAITCAPNFETQKYLELKKRKAAEVGIALRVVELPDTVSTEEAVACVQAVASQVDGVVVQLPFPTHVDREALLAAVPVEKDPDGFAYGMSDAACIPPVTAAILAIAKTYNVDFLDKNIVVLGQGRLVGAPAARFLRAAGAPVTVLTEADFNEAIVKEADVIITGIGKPHFVTPDMVKEGVVIFDAGTSEDGGVVVGDVRPDVAEAASLFTPVPGGIGPITIAALLQNLLFLVNCPK